MGYESRLYIVEKSDSMKDNDTGLFYAERIAIFNLSCVYELSNILTAFPKTDVYIFADDGDTMITEDKYGKPLTEISIPVLISILESIISKNDYYRRYNPLLQMLKGFKLEDWENLVVLHYGY